MAIEKMTTLKTKC